MAKTRYREILELGASDMLSESFLEKIGLSEAEQSKLAGMNDEGKSFMEIAAYIRANL